MCNRNTSVSNVTLGLISQTQMQSQLMQLRSIFDSYQSSDASSSSSFANPGVSQLYNQQISSSNSIHNNLQQEIALDFNEDELSPQSHTLLNPMRLDSMIDSHQSLDASSSSSFLYPGITQLYNQQQLSSNIIQNNLQRGNVLNSNDNQSYLQSYSTLSNPTLFSATNDIRNMFNAECDSTPNSSDRRQGGKN